MATTTTSATTTEIVTTQPRPYEWLWSDFAKSIEEEDDDDDAERGGNANPERPTAESKALTRARLERHERRRLRWMLCRCFGGTQSKQPIADIARLMANINNAPNVSSLDLAAGFVLVARLQRAQRKLPESINNNSNRHHQAIKRYLSGVPIREDTQFLDLSRESDSKIISELMYYLDYSVAVFGWPLASVYSPQQMCCAMRHLRLCANSSALPPTHHVNQVKPKDDDDDVDENRNQKKRAANMLVFNDNFCGCNSAAARQMVQMRRDSSEYEIVCVHLESNCYVVPFLVAADHTKRTIVVSIRGSLSLDDAITDLSAESVKFPAQYECPDDWLCHRGIASAAEYIKTKLISGKILELARNCRPDLGSSQYELVLCGQSLGAGVAAILGVLLLKQNHTKSLRALLFQPPAGTMSAPVVEFTKQFAISVTIGYDIVARFGIVQSQRLRYLSLLCLSKSQQSKPSLLARIVCPCFSGSPAPSDDTTFSEQDAELLAASGPGGHEPSDCKTFVFKGNKIKYQKASRILMMAPGKIIHIVKDPLSGSASKPSYRAIWTNNQDYDHIWVARSMFADHFPQRLRSGLKKLYSRRQLDR